MSKSSGCAKWLSINSDTKKWNDLNTCATIIQKSQGTDRKKIYILKCENYTRKLPWKKVKKKFEEPLWDNFIPCHELFVCTIELLNFNEPYQKNKKKFIPNFRNEQAFFRKRRVNGNHNWAMIVNGPK